MDEKLQKQLVDAFTKRFSNYNEKVLRELGSTIAKFEALIPSDAYKLAQQLKYNTTIKELEYELSKITKMSIKDIRKVLERVVKDNIAFAEPYYESQGLDAPIYEKSEELKRLVHSVAKLSSNEFVNIARSTGFKLLDKDGKPLLLDIKETYHKVIDEAVYAVTTGKETYNQQIKKIINQLSSSGVRKLEFESGYSRRLDTSIQMNVFDSIRQVSNECQRLFGEEFGSNGVEITIESNPAPDHEDVQGHQFSHVEFEKFQNHKDCYDYKGNFISHKKGKYERRQISEYNCRHLANQVILEVDKPLYSDEELQKIIDDNHRGVEIDGKQYTMYEVTQLQRKLETEIRKSKELNIVARSANNEDLMLKSKQRITMLRNKYKQVSKQSNLREDFERLYVPNYKFESIVKENEYTAQEQAALDYYISPSSITLNEKLRNHKELTKKEIKVVQDLDKALVKTSNYEGLIVRDLEIKDVQTFMKNVKINEPYSTNQYLSFSTGKRFNEYANVRIFIENSKSAKDLTKINTINENEVLYERNRKFKTLNIKEKDGIIYVLWEEME